MINITAYIIITRLSHTNITEKLFEIKRGVRCNEISTILISVAILITARSLGCTESIAVTGTGLKDENTVILSFSASSVTYFDLLAVQNIDVNEYYITGTFKLPVSFLLQLTLLKNVTPNANMYLLVSGMIVVFVCSITMPVSEYVKLRRKDGQDEHEIRAGHTATNTSLYIAIPKQTSES